MSHIWHAALENNPRTFKAKTLETAHCLNAEGKGKAPWWGIWWCPDQQCPVAAWDEVERSHRRQDRCGWRHPQNPPPLQSADLRKHVHFITTMSYSVCQLLDMDCPVTCRGLIKVKQHVSNHRRLITYDTTSYVSLKVEATHFNKAKGNKQYPFTFLTSISLCLILCQRNQKQKK